MFLRDVLVWTETLPGVCSMRLWPELLRSSLSSWHLMWSTLVEWLPLGRPFWRLPTLILRSCTCQTSFLLLLIGHTGTGKLSSVVACLILLSSMAGLATCPRSFSCDAWMVPPSTQCTAQWIMTAWVKDSGYLRGSTCLAGHTVQLFCCTLCQCQQATPGEPVDGG